MFIAADFADWLEQEAQKEDDRLFGNEEKGRKKEIEEFADAHPELFAVAFVWDTIDDINNVTASVTNGRAMRKFSTGMVVDLARLGTGAGEGTAGGIFQDVLRVISIVPWGRVSEWVGIAAFRTAGPIINRFNRANWGSIRGGTCVPISIGQALERTGQFLFVTLDDVVRAMGRRLESFSGIDGKGASTAEAVKALKQLKAVFQEFTAGTVKTWDDVIRYAKSNDGVLLLSIKRLRNGETGYHRIVVSNTRNGVKIFDRAGVFNSLEELSKRYGSINPAQNFYVNTSNPLLLVKNWAMNEALVAKLNSLGPLGMVVVKGVDMVLGFNPSVGSDEVKEEYRKFVEKRQSAAPVGNPEIQSVPLKHTHRVAGPRVERHDWLSSIAQKWYGDMLLWPVLFDYNRDAAFTNPNKIVVGQVIKVPDISAKTMAELNNYRSRGREWRQAAV